MFKYSLTLLLLLLISISAVAQQDTIHISKVNVVANRLHHFSVTEKQSIIDSISRTIYGNTNIGTLLKKTTLINFSSNGGLGALAGVRIRGASNTHTSVVWNGIPINSLTTGSADFSLMNTALFNDIRIVYGAEGTLYGSGTSGGAIELNNLPSLKPQKRVGITSTFGSFSNTNNSIYAEIVNKHISYSGQIFYQYGKNNFSYTDIHDFGHPREEQVNNSNRVMGTIQNIQLRFDKNYIDMGAWYQIKKKKIGSVMGIGEPKSNQMQRDSSLRLFIGWKRLFGQVRLEAKTAYIYDFLRYTDKPIAHSKHYSIYSEISTRRWLNECNARYYALNNLTVDFNLKYNKLKGYAKAYTAGNSENETRLSSAIKYTPKLGTFIASYAKSWSSQVNSPDLFSFSSLLHLMPHWIDIRAKAAMHFRRPTFNERYWVPGGNKDVKSEQGWNMELGINLVKQNLGNGALWANITAYSTDNKNTIAWQPDGSNWSVFNTGKTQSQGLEAEINYNKNIGRILLQSAIKYTYNDVLNNNKTSENYKKTLPYCPHHIGNISVDAIAKKWSIGALATFRSEVATHYNQSVEGNILVDFYGTYHYTTNFANIKLMARIENIFNKSYELVRTYPMPGRAFYIGINVEI